MLLSSRSAVKTDFLLFAVLKQSNAVMYGLKGMN